MKPTQNDLLVRVIPDVIKKGETIKPTDMFIGKVIKHGPECKFIKTGNTVVFPPFGISNVVIDDKEFIVVNEGHIKLYE